MVADLIAQDVVTGGGISFIIGGISGYALKKLAKIVAIILGTFTLAIAGLEYYNIISVDWDKVRSVGLNATQYAYQNTIHIANHLQNQMNTATTGAVGIGFILGFAIGLKKG